MARGLPSTFADETPMHSPERLKIFAALLTLALLISSAPLRAQDGPQHTRPRRATPHTAEETPAPEPRAELERLPGEPVLRIGLAVNARSVNVSTTGRLLATTEPDAAPTPLDIARVRVEPRTLPPVNPQTEADPLEAIDSQAAAAKTQQPPTPKTGIQLTARVTTPSRGEVLYAPGSAKPLLDARAPVLFASDEEEQHPVRLNEKAYRGRIEVFANTRGTLTVVNVVGLEDYVRGVVPNELSPGGWPEIEALKAQAVAARTYAVSNLGRYRTEGFDLTPDTRSQVYGGRSTEHPLTDRAVGETRGRVATYNGRPINALYTSTCGGRTENAENIFGGESVPYLRGRECALEASAHFAPYQLRTSRPSSDIKRAEHASSARDAALLTTHGFAIPSRLTDEWLAAPVTADEVRSFLGSASALAHQPLPFMGEDVSRPGGFASALAAALDGESRGAALLSTPDIEYLLSFRDADEVPLKNRADVAAMLREGHLSLFPDATLRPRLPLARARALRSISHALEARELFRLQKATARPAANGSLVLRPSNGKGPDRTLAVAPDAFLFRAFGEELYQQRELSVVGGEQLTFHADANGRADYVEVRPGPAGASADRFSVYASWAETLTPNGVLSRLGRSAPNVGTIQDLRVRRRGVSGRVLDLEVVGSTGTAHVRGGRVRSALGLREQLFVIDREYDEAGRVVRFTFAGRGWGHGVGMCQVGAYGLARGGLTYDKILKSFYTGISVSKLY
jgi:stage II sporulation protein D